MKTKQEIIKQIEQAERNTRPEEETLKDIERLKEIEESIYRTLEKIWHLFDWTD